MIRDEPIRKGATIAEMEREVKEARRRADTASDAVIEARLRLVAVKFAERAQGTPEALFWRLHEFGRERIATLEMVADCFEMGPRP